MGIKQQAWRDLLTRYNAIFRHAWQRRKEMAPPERLPHEAQFLPATLALQETPVHPAPRMAMGAILLFAIIALLWAVLGHVDVVATATGKVIPDSRSKVIQPMETANIHAIYVKDGQAVKIGDPLIDLDATAAQADVERLENDLSNARYERTRAIAMLDAIEQNHLPVLSSIPDQDDTVRLEAEQRLILGQYQEFRAKVDQLDAEISRREAKRRSILAIVEKIQQTLPIAKQRSEDYKNLLDKNFVSKHGYLQMEQARIEQERDLAAQKEKQAEILASRIEAERQKGRLIAETKRELLDQKHKATQLSATLEQELLKAENRGKLLHLTAPVEGTVQQLAVHTVGGVVTSAQPLMVIVPQDNPLEVEAFVPNKDIGFIRQGQSAQVKVETFTFTKYGIVEGEVVHVSSDAIQDEKLGLIFSARVRLKKDTIWVEDRPVKLSPGMAVTVEIKTGKRRLIEYFLGPLIQYSSESLRER